MITLLALLLSSSTPAAPLVCAASNVFYEKIYNCGENRVATEYGRLCADQVIADAKANGKKLHALMNEMKKNLGHSQTASMADARKRLEMGIKDLTAQIKSMQSNTSTVASYAEAMIDFPDSDSDATSPDCFNENFHALQKIVNEMDREIINAKKAHKEASALLGSLGRNSRDMTTMGGARSVASDKKPLPPAAAGPKGRDFRASDISGTEKKQPKK